MRLDRLRLQSWLRADWGVLLRCLWLIPVVEFSVRWRAPRRWLPSPAAARPGSSADPEATARGQEIARWMDAAYRRSPFSPTCLSRSLVLYRLLRARSIPCRLQIGLRREAAQLDGHAWVEPGRTQPEAAGYDVLLSF